MRHIKRKNKIIIASILIAAIVWGCAFYDINRRFPKTVVEEYRCGETLEFKNHCFEEVMIAEISPDSLVWYEGEEFEKRYPKTAEEYIGTNRFKVLKAAVIMENKGDESFNVGKYAAYFTLCNDRYGWSNGGFTALEQETVLQPGEKRSVDLVYVINFHKKSMMNEVLDSEFYIKVASYPIERKLVYERANKAE